VRLISSRTDTGETLGVVDGDRWIRATALVLDGPATMAAWLTAEQSVKDALRDAAATGQVLAHGEPIDALELLAPVPSPGKVVAIGRNYRAHAEEEGVEPPPAPLIFSKWPSSVVGHGAQIRWDPGLTSQVDYEAELAVVIGHRARRVSERDALEYVAGYTCLNDVSARDLQFGDGQWTRGKSLDTFCPTGPVMVTADEIPDPQDLAICCTVGDERVQDGHTSEITSVSPRLSATAPRRSRSSLAMSSRRARRPGSASSGIRRASSGRLTS
jgi:2,4-didehydro-3-deoxy-L-rhamnonate hydrolase